MIDTSIRTCRRGHTSERRRKPSGGWSDCWLCARAYNKAYREANREEILARKKAYYETNRELLKSLAPDCETRLAKLAYDKAYREANREEIRAQQKAYREANREKKLAYAKAYYARKKAERAVG